MTYVNCYLHVGLQLTLCQTCPGNLYTIGAKFVFELLPEL